MLECEKQGVDEILRSLSLQDLLSVASTSTKQLILPENTQEAIDAIFLHAESSEDILLRKKVTTQVLLQYIHKHSINVGKNINKHQLITAILQYWDNTGDKENVPAVMGAELQQGQLAAANTVAVQPDNYGVTRAVPQTAYDVTRQAPISCDVTWAFLEQYTTWFYQLLNSINRNYSTPSSDTWGPQHFYSDCRLEERLCSGESVQDDHVTGATDIALHIQNTIHQHNIMFQPNLSREGVRGVTEQHGLQMVQVSGTLHQPGNCCGVFTHEFGLAQDPMNSSWKIKYLKLLMKASNHGNELPHNANLAIN